LSRSLPGPGRAAAAYTLLAVGGIERGEILGRALLQLGEARPDFAAGEVLVTGVHALEFAAIDRRQRPSEQAEIATDHDELRAGRADRQAVVATEVGDGLEVRGQSPSQPHQLDIASAFALQPAAGLDAVEVAVHIQLQQHRPMIARPAGRRRDHRKAERVQVQRFNESLDHPHRIVSVDVILKRRRQKRSLSAIRALDEAMHDHLRSEVRR
jgi:hypothetical protein